MASGLAYVMNDSLTPTKLDSKNPISPSNYPDKRSMVNAFKRMVQVVLDSPEDRTKLHRMLKEFHNSLVVEELMERLRPLLNPPRHRKLYLALRPLIPSRLRAEYNSLIPHIPSYQKKVVHLKQNGSRSMGFNIRGGKEFGCGIYITSVLLSSKANQAGLKVGDEVIRINGLILSESTHEEVVNIINLKKTLTLTAKSVGMIPEQDFAGNVTWKTVEERKPRGPVNPMKKLNNAILRSTKKIQVTVREGESLGASIRITSDKSSGVFISELIPNSIAYESGLSIGDEMIEVNGQSLINLNNREAVRLLKSSESLMLTIRNKDPTVASQYLSNPPEDFEMNPHDIDMDAELIYTDPDASYGFVLRSKDGLQGKKQNEKRGGGGGGAGYKKRLSLTDMDTERDVQAPTIASPAAFGFGPSLAMPTLLRMMTDIGNLDEEEDDSVDGEIESTPMRYLEDSLRQQLSPEQMAAVRQSMIFPDISQHENGLSLDFTTTPPKSSPQAPPPAPPSAAPPKQNHDMGARLNHQKVASSLPPQPLPPTTALKPRHEPVEKSNPTKSGHNISGADLASYQFPVEDEDAATASDPPLSQQPATSAFKKGGVKKKTPAFKENVEIIDVRTALSSNSTDNLETVHPSNMEFSDKVLQGRRVAFHTVPKDGPIKIAIRGGTDTPLGGAIIISRILDGGAADRYGKLNVGDQILVCDGVNLIDVTHDEAAQALKKAMDMESRSIDLVVAVNPDVEPQSEERVSPPRTMWPPPEESDTVCDDHPTAIVKGYDYAKSSRRAHSGFTMRGERAAETAHNFLPKT